MCLNWGGFTENIFSSFMDRFWWKFGTICKIAKKCDWRWVFLDTFIIFWDIAIFLPKNRFFAKKFTNFGCIFWDHQCMQNYFDCAIMFLYSIQKIARILFLNFDLKFFLQAIMLEDRSIYLKWPKIPFFSPIFLYNSRSKLKSKKRIRAIFCIFVRIPNLQSDFF